MEDDGGLLYTLCSVYMRGGYNDGQESGPFFDPVSVLGFSKSLWEVGCVLLSTFLCVQRASLCKSYEFRQVGLIPPREETIVFL